MDSLELTHPTLLHPRTGEPLRAVGVLPNGRVVWPIMGGDGTEADANDTGDNTGEGDDTGTGQDDTDTGENTGEDDNLDDPNEQDPRVKRANRQAAQYRTQLRETQQQLTQLQQGQEQSNGVLDALRRALTGDTGEGDENADPAEQLATLTGEAEQLRSTNAQLTAALLVHELAPENGGNPNALLDSRRFTDALAGLDPAADDYRDQVAKAIEDAAKRNTNLRAGQGPSRGGSETAGQGAGAGAAVTADQFAAMSYADRTELFRTNPSLYRQLAGKATT